MFRTIVKLSRPLIIFLTALTYMLGGGIAHYLGPHFYPAAFGLGLLAVIALQCASILFTEYFRLPQIPLSQNETHLQRERFAVLLLQVSFAAMTISIVATMTMFFTGLMNLFADIFILMAFLILTGHSIPPIRFSETGYGELAQAIVLGTILPGFGFLLQFGEFHRFLPIITFPITLLALVFLLVCNFQSFATDQKLGRQTLLTRLTWQNAIPIHHFLVLTSYLLISAAPILGVPWRIIWPSLLTIPFAFVQIYWLQKIANGGRTLWNFLIPLSSATFGLIVYLLAMTFWLG